MNAGGRAWLGQAEAHSGQDMPPLSYRQAP